ncbi:Stage IV sporulation protein FB [Planctomycetes bacterium Pan216]|uniref:Stage IV sporulation protein FB n=1 Tax=Kolteria novifilia TaxID=2527975 RepID=A0A518AYM7_9BACT|nr:Stage IV sporulation protein FB [Planctomycetes bacterium Pan216]
MFKSLYLGRPFGIRTFVHWSFWILLAFVAFINMKAGLAAILLTILMIIAVFGCVLLHEFGHALTARRFGINTHDIVLYPIGGIARLERMPEQPSKEFLIAIAGPAVNFVIAFLLWMIDGFDTHVSNEHMQLMAIEKEFIEELLLINLVLGIFNLLPAFPMDGGRVLRSLLATRLSYLRATEIATFIGMILAGGMVLLGFLTGNPILFLIAVFVWMAGGAELAYVRHRHGTRVRTPFDQGGDGPTIDV